MKKILFALVSLLFMACADSSDSLDMLSKNKVYLTEKEYLSIAHDGTKELDKSEVMTMVSNFISDMAARKESRTFQPVCHLNMLSKSYYVPLDTVNKSRAINSSLRIPIYVLNYQVGNDDGVVYFSADERNPEVIALISKLPSNNQEAVASGFSFLLEWAEKSSYENLLEVEKYRKKLSEQTIEKICSQLGIDKQDFCLESIKDHIVVEQLGSRTKPIDMPQTQIVSMCNPIVKTEWSQGSPYNLALPVPMKPSVQQHVYTGCAVTAACQLLTAIKPDLTIDGTLMDWNALTETTQVSESASKSKLDMLGKLHKWVYEQLDAQPMYDSNGFHTGTGVSANDQVWFYGHYFNHSEEYGAYDPDALLRSFRNSSPSLIRGQGHAWVLDGYIVCDKETTETALASKNTSRVFIKYYDIYWHANLGWGGTANGYYKVNPDTHVNFESGNYVFTTDGLYVYPGLYKKNEKIVVN